MPVPPAPVAKQDSLHFDVEIYPTDLPKLQNKTNPLHPYLKTLQTLEKQGLDIAPDAFVHWALCLELSDDVGYRTKKELERWITSLRESLTRHCTMDGPSLRWRRAPLRPTTEYLGVGGSLTLATRVFDLSDADVHRIPEATTKTMDFEFIRNNGGVKILVEVESKGTADAAARHDHAKSIRDKKTELRADPNRPKTLLCGIIVDVPYTEAGEAKLSFLDPPPETPNADPEWIQLIRRLRYYRCALRLFYRGALTFALADRIRVLEQPEMAESGRWRAFDKLRLPRADGRLLEAENLSLPIVYKGMAGTLHGRPLHSLKPQRDRDEQPGASEKSRTPSFVFGLHRDVVLALAAQDFGRINSLLFEPARVEADTASGTGTLRLLRSGLVLSSVFPTREPGGNAAAPTP